MPLALPQSQEFRASFYGITAGVAVAILLQFAFNRDWQALAAGGLGISSAPLDLLLMLVCFALFSAAAGAVCAYPMVHIRRANSLATQYLMALGAALVLALLNSLLRTQALFDGVLLGVWLSAALVSVALTDLIALKAGRTVVELLHIVVGIFAAVLIASLSTWSYPLAESDIWLTAYVAMIAVVLMGVGPIRRAYEEDKATMANAAREPKAGSDA